MRVLFIIAGIVLLQCLVAGTGRTQDFRNAPPGEVWRTIESPHFSITFPEHDLRLAQRLIDMAEYYYPIMTRRMGWTPSRKTYLLISNATDSANAETTPSYYDNIVIFAIPPDAYDSIINYDDWLQMIFTHEYTHILHLDQARGFFGFLNDVFGRILFVNQVEPDWIIEGYAVYNESTLTSAGRDNGSYYNMVLRMQALHNDLPPIDKGDGTPSVWPFGEYPYIYGGKFMQYLAGRYSAAALADYSREYTYLPLFLNRAARIGFGDNTFTGLWKQWYDSIRKQALLSAVSLMLSWKTVSHRVTHSGAYTRGPVWSDTGRTIYYTSYSGKTQMGIFSVDPDTGHTSWVARRNSGYTGSVCDGRFFFSQEEFYRNFYLYNDLYELDTRTRRVRKLTSGVRVHGADASPDCSEVVFVSNTSSVSSLMVYHRADPGFITTIAQLHGTGQFLDPRWSWDGRDIAVTVKDDTGGSAIRILGRGGQDLTTVVSGNHLNLFPSWSRDDRYVLFSSDMTGRANLYAFSLTDATLYQVTNVMSGAYEAQVSPDNRTIAFTQYDDAGFDISTMPFSPSTFRRVQPAHDFTVEQLNRYPHVRTAEKPYSPFSTLVPTWWLPAISSASDTYSLGVSTAGSDLLGHNQYTIQAGYTGYSGNRLRPGFSATYDNTSFTPDIGVAGEVTPFIAATYKDPVSGTSHSYLQQDSAIAVNVTYPFNHVRYRQTAGAGYAYTYRESLSRLPSFVVNPPFSGTLSGLTLNYTLDTTSMFNTSVSKEDGVSFVTNFERDLSVLGSDRDLSQSYSMIKAYLPGFGVNHVIYAKGIYGFTGGASRNDALFSIGGVQPFYTAPDYTSVPARGYPAGTLTGTRAFAATLEYRYPLGVIDRGIGTLPVYLDKVSLFPFVDVAGTTRASLTSTGVELNLDTYIGYLFPFRFTLGYAYAYNIYPASSFYFLIGEIIP